jgi:hypothetical protein
LIVVTCKRAIFIIKDLRSPVGISYFLELTVNFKLVDPLFAGAILDVIAAQARDSSPIL